MNSEKAVTFIAGVVLGLLVGLVVPKLFTGGGEVAPPPAPLAPPTVNYEETINRLKVVVEKDPQNYDAWVQLGNTYFDSNQPSKSVDAYKKALELDSSSADVHTDLGIMYRKLQRPGDAVAEFKKAMELDPRHFQSRQNLGIVMLHDLNDYRGAIEAWEELLRVEPAGQRADRIKEQLETMRRMEVERGKPGAPVQPSEPGLPPVPPGVGGMPFPPPVAE